MAKIHDPAPRKTTAMLMKTAPLYLRSADDPSHPQARACAACAVRSQALFGALDASGLERIHAHIASPSLAADERVFTQGQPAGALYTVRSGIVRFERAGSDGSRRILRLAGRGDLIGQEALLQRPYADDAVACTPVELCRIPHSLVEELADQESAMMRELMQRWQHALQEATAWADELRSGPALRRVLQLLKVLARHTDEQGRIWLPRREEIADMLDMTVETASRLVSRLRRDGVLELHPPRHARVETEPLRRALEEADA
jgi:CRP/FNR family transcriptional regulator, anaerobic regulatory protein